MPSSPVLLHIYLVSGYACYYCCMPSSSVLLHIYCLVSLIFGTVIPTSFNILMFYTCLTDFFVIYLLANTMLCQPHPFCCSWSCEMHLSNNEEMAFNYMQVLVYRSFTQEPYKDSAGERHCKREFEAVWYKNQGKYVYQFCARPFEELEEEEEEEDGEIGVLAISHMSL